MKYHYTAKGRSDYPDVKPESVAFTVTADNDQDADAKARDWIVNHCNLSLAWAYERKEVAG